MADNKLTTPEETWKTVEDWPKYEVSSLGRIRSHWWSPPRLLAPSPDVQGRLRITVTNELRQHKTPRVHVLVASAFLGPKPRGLQINHKNGICTDNSASNLEYCTPQENTNHAVLYDLNPKGERVGTAKLTAVDVRKIRALYDGREYSSRRLAKQFGVSRPTIMKIIKRIQWKHVE